MRKGIPEDVAQEVVGEFEAAGLVNDRDFAMRFAELGHTEMGLSRRAIGMKLRHKGIDEPLIAEAVEHISDSEQRDRAVEVALRRAPKYQGLDQRVWQRRLAGYLQRKGYDTAEVMAGISAAANWLESRESAEV